MDQIDDHIIPEAGHVNGTSVVGATESSGDTEADPPTTEAAPPEAADPIGLRPGFLSELAVAMRATAERERANIGNRVAGDAAGHIEKVRARAAIETEELRRLAEEDVQHIEEWSASEMERIRSEADQKIGVRRASLDRYLTQHDAIIETEIEGVDASVRDYNTTLDTFFAELAASDDPSTIVARAETLPAPPDLDQVSAQARASAVAMFVQPDAEEKTPETAAVVDRDTGSDDDAPPDSIASAESSIDGDMPRSPGDADATAEAVATETETESTSTADPVPVMDPAANAGASWPEKEPGSEEAELAPTFDHTSPAVHLLRSVAPWTAPTHAGSDRDPDSD